MKLTGSLIVCAAAGLFTVGALVLNDGSTTTAASSGGPEVGPTTQVEISDFTFAAAPVAPGSTVTVANRDGESHTLTAANGSFDTGQIPSGKAVAFLAPSAPGTYQIVCTIHPSMHSELVVT
jgi:plastocyanin